METRICVRRGMGVGNRESGMGNRERGVETAKRTGELDILSHGTMAHNLCFAHKRIGDRGNSRRFLSAVSIPDSLFPVP